MRLVPRRRPSGPEDFWSWWEREGRALTTLAGERGAAAGDVDALGRAVSALHPELSWEVAAGEESTHVLIVTAAGNPDLRADARRWLVAAPAHDETWSYADHRLPRSDPESVILNSGLGEDVDFARISVSARATGSRFDVSVHHPAFADLIGPARAQVAFLALDIALGEHDVELWLGEITASEVSLVDGFGLSALRAVVADLRSRHVDADGQPTWAVLSGEGPDGPVLALAQVPLHPATAPVLAQHAVVLLPYAAVDEEGFPQNSSLEALRGFEDTLNAALGPTGHIVAHESAAGVRVLHLYLDEASDARSVVRRHAARWSEGRARTEATLDPSWSGVRHLRG